MSTYKKIPDKINNKGNADEKKIIENKEVVNRMFITLKDHKTNFLNIPFSLIKPIQKRTRQNQESILDRIILAYGI